MKIGLFSQLSGKLSSIKKGFDNALDALTEAGIVIL